MATLTSSGPNLISVFNAATFNVTRTTGCGQTPAMLKVGDSGGAHTTGCGQAHPKVAVGNYPGATTIDPASGTATSATATTPSP